MIIDARQLWQEQVQEGGGIVRAGTVEAGIKGGRFTTKETVRNCK